MMDTLPALIGDRFEISTADQIDLSSFRILLADRIYTMLSESPLKLFNIFYRIDLREGQVKYMISHYKDRELAEKLCDLVINREREKMNSRAKYKSKDGEG
jgi:hypothetical protein